MAACRIHPDGATAGPVPVPNSQAQHRIDSDSPPDIDSLSRSLPTAGPVLEPEAAVLAVCLPVSASQCSHDDDVEAVSGADLPSPSETSPLLPARRHSSVGAIAHDDDDVDDDEAPLYLAGVSPRQFWLIFGVILMVLFIACFDGTIMASSHPVITSYFGAANSASWLSTAFLLTSTAFQPLLGRLSDALGRKPLYLGALCVFVVATAWCALAQSIGSFIAARALCGLGAGGAMTLGSIITSDLVPIERRGAYQSYINIVYGFGSALGAAAGGAMAESLGWRWEFGIQIPPLIVCLCMAAVAIPDELGIEGERKSTAQALREFDAGGSVLLTLSISSLILGLNFGGNIVPWSHPLVIAALVLFAVCFPAFLVVEFHVSKPIMPPRLIMSHPRANLIFANAIGALLTNAIYFNIPIFFQAVLLMSATNSGLYLVLPTLVSSAVGACTGFAITYTRRLKWPLVCGATCYLIGSLCLSGLHRALPPAFFLLALVPSAVGGGFQFPGSIMAVLASSPQSEQAVVSATLLLWRSLGMVLGIAASSLVLQNALVYYLDLYVSGEAKDEVIRMVRASVEAVAKLDEPYREQAVHSYEAALRLTFGFCVVIAAISVCLVLPMKLARLPARRRGIK